MTEQSQWNLPPIKMPMGATPVVKIPTVEKLPVEIQKDEYLAFCVATKDQAVDLPEFLRHHYYHMNVSHFYIMDDRSNPPTSTLRPWQGWGIPDSSLTFTHYTNEEAAKHPPGIGMQLYIDKECMERFGNRHVWMGFVDVDEYFEVHNNETLEGILREFEEQDSVGALGVNWRTNTSSGLLTRPESVRDSFVVCINDPNNLLNTDIGPLDKYIKSIVRTSEFDTIDSPHQFNLKKGKETVGEDGLVIKPGNGQRIPFTRNRVGLHHYAVKSRAEFEQKMSRWNGDSPRSWKFWDAVEQVPSVECLEMSRRYFP